MKIEKLCMKKARGKAPKLNIDIYLLFDFSQHLLDYLYLFTRMFYIFLIFANSVKRIQNRTCQMYRFFVNMCEYALTPLNITLN